MLNVVSFLRLGLLIHSDELLYNHAKVRRKFRHYTALSADHKTDRQFTFKRTFTDFNMVKYKYFLARLILFQLMIIVSPYPLHLIADCSNIFLDLHAI